MAIYRPPRPRWRAAAASAVTGLVVGVLAGLAIGGGDDPAAALEEVRAQLSAAANTLGVVEIEYEEGVDEGRVVVQSEYEGALGAIDRSRAQFQEVAEALEVLSPVYVEDVVDGYDRLERLAGQPAPPDELAPAIGELRAALTTFAP